MDQKDRHPVSRICIEAFCKEFYHHPVAANSPANEFSTRECANITLQAYMDRIVKYGDIRLEAMLMGFKYLADLALTGIIEFSNLNVHRLILASMRVANKFYDDVYFGNVLWARVGGVPVHELCDLETAFLWMVKYDLMMSPDDYAWITYEIRTAWESDRPLNFFQCFVGTSECNSAPVKEQDEPRDNSPATVAAVAVAVAASTAATSTAAASTVTVATAAAGATGFRKEMSEWDDSSSSPYSIEKSPEVSVDSLPSTMLTPRQKDIDAATALLIISKEPLQPQQKMQQLIISKEPLQQQLQQKVQSAQPEVNSLLQPLQQRMQPLQGQQRQQQQPQRAPHQKLQLWQPSGLLLQKTEDTRTQDTKTKLSPIRAQVQQVPIKQI